MKNQGCRRIQRKQVRGWSEADDVEAVNKVISAVADEENAAADDQGYYCQFCKANRVWFFDQDAIANIKHDPDCVVLLARKLRSKLGKT